jgi:hypothetical protein
MVDSASLLALFARECSTSRCKEHRIAKNRNTYAKRQREQEKRQRADDKRLKREKKLTGSSGDASTVDLTNGAEPLAGPATPEEPGLPV